MRVFDGFEGAASLLERGGESRCIEEMGDGKKEEEERLKKLLESTRHVDLQESRRKGVEKPRMT